MRRLLGILSEDEPQAALAPRPGLDRLGDLVAQAQRAGLPVELTVDGEPAMLPRGVDLAAYRIVQEALTNARKHAAPGRARVAVSYAGGTLDLKIVNDGKSSPTTVSGGHGLTGMRERVTLYGGELEAGPRAEGGYAVHARLPVEMQP